MPMFHIKKTAVIFVLAFAVLHPLTAHAATIVFSPTHVTVHVGQSFSINVAVSTSAVRAYTVKTDGRFTSPTIRLSKWTYGDAWTVLRQPGYDSFDNTLGTWIRTAGYTDGFTGTINFAKATFVAGAVGTGTIALDNNSFIYDSASTNIYSGANKVMVDVLPAVVATPTMTPAIAPIATPTTNFPETGPATPEPSCTVSSIPDHHLWYDISLFIIGLLCGAGLVMILKRHKR